MLIYLIGYMASGKTTAGKRLANKLGYTFLDLDELIEKEEQKTIPEIFEERGESGFREIEKQVLVSTISLENTVVSTGGGAPCFFNNMEIMNQYGLTIYIELTPKALVSRLKSAKDQRPLIKDKSEAELLEFIESALEKRNVFYQQAKISINGIGLTADILIKEIEKHT